MGYAWCLFNATCSFFDEKLDIGQFFIKEIIKLVYCLYLYRNIIIVIIIMSVIKQIEASLGYKKKPKINIGDSISLKYETKSGYWSVRQFTGLCVSKSCKGFNERYVLRNVVSGHPVEFSFYRYWNLIISLEKLGAQKFSKVRRGSLLYLRSKPTNFSKVRG
jgi:ribosomal protein L19